MKSIAQSVMILHDSCKRDKGRVDHPWSPFVIALRPSLPIRFLVSRSSFAFYEGSPWHDERNFRRKKLMQRGVTSIRDKSHLLPARAGIPRGRSRTDSYWRSLLSSLANTAQFHAYLCVDCGALGRSFLNVPGSFPNEDHSPVA